MKLYQVVTKDLIRRKRSLLYAALGVLIGVMTVVSVLTITRTGEASIYAQLEKYGPNLTIIPAVNSLDMSMGNLRLGTLTVGENYIPEELIPRIRETADSKIKEALGIEEEGNIAVVAPKLYLNALIKDVSVTVVGIQPEEEWKIKTWWNIHEGQYLSTADQGMMGAIAAERLALTVGGRIKLNEKDVTVTGILEETGSSDDYQLFVPLATLQKAYGKEGLVSVVDIRALCNACPVEVIADSINGAIPGVRAIAVKQVAEAEMGVVERTTRFMFVLAGIALVVGLFGVLNTMMASVHARIKDIGIMRAVGASRRQILSIFLYEAVIVGVIGGILGYVVGTLIALAIAPLILNGAQVTYVPWYSLLAITIAVAIAVTATVYPAFRATRIRVADAFRSL